ncbi:MAG TPA: IS110 family transposase [Sphaerochaeta sp.]|nr:IS110 family transposase [Sphaerochaeta sp.]
MKTAIGIDISQSSSSFHLLGDGESRDHSGSFTMSRSGFEQLLKCVSHVQDPVFFMESTGRYHITLAHFLLQEGHKPAIVNPVLVKQFSKANTLRKTKTDKIDAQLIARYGQQAPKEIQANTRAMDDQRLSIARRREQVAEQVATAKTQLKADLTVAWPEILVHDVFTKGMLRLLVQYPCAQAIVEASDEQLVQALTPTRGRGLSLTAATLRSLAEESIGVPTYGPLVSDSAQSLLFLNQKLEQLTETLVALVRETQDLEMQIITSVPGIGEITAAHFLAEIGSIDRFERYQNLIAFSGTDPSTYESGTIYKRGKITKRGNASLRKYLFLMATGVNLHNPYFKAYYDKKRAEGFPHRKAMVAQMNKILKTLFAMLKKQEMFIVPN